MQNKYSQLKVLHDKNGYYVGRSVFCERSGAELPFIRLSDYYGNPHMATKFLNALTQKGAIA